MSWLEHIFVDPSVAGVIFLAQVASFALIQIWRAGRQASREELGGRSRPRHDILHLVLTGLAVVLGLVLLIIWISHPIKLASFGKGNALPLIAFLIFVYVTLVIGTTSSHRTSGNGSNPWFAALLLLMAALLLVLVIMLPMLIPSTYVPKQYQSLISLGITIAGVLAWPLVAQRIKGRRRSAS